MPPSSLSSEYPCPALLGGTCWDSGMGSLGGGTSCAPLHLVLTLTARYHRSYLAIPASSWVDDFLDWLTPASFLSTSCCRIYTRGDQLGQFCPSTERELEAASGGSGR